jgi:hypothetical protein
VRRSHWLTTLFAALIFAAPGQSSAQKGKPAVCQVEGVICQGELNITSLVLEMVPQVRSFSQFERISGDDPTIATHETKSMSYGFSLAGGIRLFGVERPVFGMIGAQFDTGLETNTTFVDGSTLHGDVSMSGLGLGLRLRPFRAGKLESFLQAMVYSQWNRGKFEIDDGAPRSETRTHVSAAGDYTAGLIYFPKPFIGLEIGAGYNGQLNKNNADENVRVLFGVTLAARELF